MSDTEQTQLVAEHRMRVDLVSTTPKKVQIVVVNPSTSTTLTGQQQYSGRKVAQMVIEALGV